QREAPRHEQFRDQFVLGAEMIVHRGEVDVRLRHDVAQGDVAKAAFGIEQLGGGEDGGSGLIARHRSAHPAQLHFKHLYETIVLTAGNVNAHLVCLMLRPVMLPSRRGGAGPKRALAARPWRRDSAAQFFRRAGEERLMDFTMSDRQKEWLGRVQAFMTQHVRPAVPIYKQQDAEGPRWKVIPVL